MSIIARTNDFSFNRPPMEFGIRWDRTIADPVDALTRLGDGVGMLVDTSDSPHISDFSSYMPFKGMERCNLNGTGDIMSVHGESQFIESAYRTMVRMPYFFCKVVPPGTDVTGPWEYWISPYPLKGYKIHPAFLRWNYTGDTMRITDVFVGAFEAETVTSEKSIAGVAPKTNYSRTNFRANFAALGAYGYLPMDWISWNALQWLYFIEYGSLKCQSPSGSTARGGLSTGITNGTAAEKTGWTSDVDVNEHGFHSVDLGNLSGQVRCNTHSGLPVYAMSYRGIENLWGNLYTAIDGVNIDTDMQYWIATTTAFADQTGGAFAYPYEPVGAYATTGGGWLRYPSWYNIPNFAADWFFGSHGWDLDASGTTYCCDYSDWAEDFTVPRYPVVGGVYDTPGGGIWHFYCGFTYDSISLNVGSRLMQIPLDIDFWRC
jgi:hypothetical protein